MSRICRDTARYFSKSGWMNSASGQRRRAREAGMAEWTPNLRTSYDAAQTTLRSPGQPTITGFPRSSGRSRCSTDA